jgi:hypothetical protein
MNTTKDVAPWNMGWAAGAASAGGLKFREPDPPLGYDDEQRTAYREGYLEGRAWQLGNDHGAAGTEPFGDLDEGGEGLLMDALGEVGWTTEDNHPLRLRLLMIYTGALEVAERNASDP